MIDTEWAIPMKASPIRAESSSSLHADLEAYFRRKTGYVPDALGMKSTELGCQEIAVANIVTSDHLILFTSGMSARPMTVPEGQEDWQYAELVMFLPRDWPVRPAANRPESSPWKWLQVLARYPLEHDCWLIAPFSTISTDELPAAQVENCPYTAFMLLYNQHYPSFLASDGRRINLITVIPLIPKNHAWQRCQPSTARPSGGHKPSR